MDITGLIPHIEALIFASDKPLTPLELTDLLNNAFGFMEDKITLDQVEAALEGIVEKYDSEFYPFEVRESGGGWQFLTKKAYHKTVAQINGDKFMKRLSPAALETLSIIAYKQPVTKGEIEAIRGVSADYAIQKLLEKELVIISGRNEKLPGHPLVYSTSKTFMDYFGINSAEELPKIREVLAEQEILPTPVDEEGNAIGRDALADTADQPLAVAGTGALVEAATVQPEAEYDEALSADGEAAAAEPETGTAETAAPEQEEPAPQEAAADHSDTEISETEDTDQTEDNSKKPEEE
ncbi:SMC-Scp complex subunit ScpB [Niabella drilacis]|uniref:Segregation and condensation protein B n=1 Tax=Niabella drilacis (strain DSM 25811 / CCM 8410 / CCUG 62505 / LMG 26954 / E90) TaxID=1285928 RepID=A0A1G6KYA3_NIADE|nr:SMC-Scp complex subunit ScpB [Niabella drilacis]SDC36060.1 segregation and condensation protein B [Niabella drilacis]